MAVEHSVILKTIKETAHKNGGKPLGKKAFMQQTGIKESEWSGIYWARWSDAVEEAGFIPNRANVRIDEAIIFAKLIAAIRYHKKLPTKAELRLYRNSIDQGFPVAALIKRFRTVENIYSVLGEYAADNEEYSDITDLCKAFISEDVIAIPASEGWVYLIQSGSHYKIGKSNNLERRIKEIRVQLPEAAILVHSIRTDDPDGIEAYWHRRFADRRANGEWFKLSLSDVAAFKRRKYQ